MKKMLLFSLALILGLTTIAQKSYLKQGIPAYKKSTGQQIAHEPVNNSGAFAVSPKPSGLKNSDGTRGFVNVITIGNSANAYGYGYWGGQKTMVWADDNLNALVNIHRMGPGSTPPSFSGYLAGDLGVNLGQSAADWTNNRQIYASTLIGPEYYLDAGRYPQGGIYNPAGNTDLANAYCVYFAPNLSNTLSTWGGYSFGSCNLVNQSDSVKELYWYSPPPYTYIPDGFTLTSNGLAFYTDTDQDWESGSVIYQGNLIYGRGIWNAASHTFDYTMSTLAMPTTDNDRPAMSKIAASPDGNTVWIVVLGNNGGAIQIGDSANYYPILMKSTDAGLTWSAPFAVQLDGPDGINGVKNYLSDYRITQLWDPPLPTRDQIPYTTAFDVDLSVDQWGNPHIGVVIGVSAGNYSIAIADSSLCVFDIYSTDGGDNWEGVAMGYPWTFRGTFGDLYEDNRVNIASTQTGDKMFVTWNDTQMPGVTDNSMPDVFARGFDLVTNKITSVNGVDEPNNVSIISEVSSSAWFHCTSHYIFTDNNKYTLPIVTEYLSVPTDLTQPVEFKYLTDFSYVDADFTISVNNPWVGVDQKKMDIATVNVYPNPAKDIATVSLNLNQRADVTLQVTSVVGHQVISKDLGTLAAGTAQVVVDVRNLASGVYFCTLNVDGQKITKKMIVQ